MSGILLSEVPLSMVVLERPFGPLLIVDSFMKFLLFRSSRSLHMQSQKGSYASEKGGGGVDGGWMVGGWWVDGGWMVGGWWVVGGWMVSG